MLKTTIITSFNEVNLKELTLPMIVVYDHPIDCPTKYVARLFDLNVGTPYAVISDTLEAVHDIIPFNFVKLDRNDNDDPVIIEVWV